ncbi:MAG: hypothetical protein KKB50_04340 [Planctomycetes bacterium]|nr:hypothetical protein [Planctomycetota bacterium]
MSTSRLQKQINRKRRIQLPLRERAWARRDRPMFTASNIHNELADRVRGLGPGGIGETLQRHERTGRPLGDDSFLTKLRDLLNRALKPKKPGRKPKKKDK